MSKIEKARICELSHKPKPFMHRSPVLSEDSLLRCSSSAIEHIFSFPLVDQLDNLVPDWTSNWSNLRPPKRNCTLFLLQAGRFNGVSGPLVDKSRDADVINIRSRLLYWSLAVDQERWISPPAKILSHAHISSTIPLGKISVCKIMQGQNMPK